MSEYDSDEDDYFDEGFQDDEEGAEADLSDGDEDVSPYTDPEHAPQPEPRRHRPRHRSRGLRVRPMSRSMMLKRPGVASVLFTHTDGRQLMLVRKGQ